MATVYLHIGTMKSGSSFLQSACKGSAPELAAAGVHYVENTEAGHAVRDLVRSNRRADHEVGAWRRLARHARESPTDTLISHELLCPVPPQTIRRVVSSVAPQSLHMILTVRDITKVVSSHWQERIQNGALVGWSEFCETACAEPGSTKASQKFWGHHDFVRVVSKWSEVLPADHITVVTVPPSRHDPELLWERFLSVLGLSGIPLKPESRSNQSLGAASAELLLRVNAELTDFNWIDRSHSTKSVLAKRTLAPRAPTEPRYTLTPEHHSILRARAAEMAEGIRAAEVRVVGDLDEIVPAEDAPSGAKPGEVTDAQMLRAAVHGLAGMSRKLAQVQTTLVTLEQERDGLLAERRKRVRARKRLAQQQRSQGPVATPLRFARKLRSVVSGERRRPSGRDGPR